MKQLDWYIGTTVASMILLALLGLFGILTLFTVLEQLQDIKNNYTVLDALVYTAYTSPRRIYEVVPYSALIGCLVGLGVLSNNSELMVMRASGVSTASIMFSVLKPVLVVVALGLFVGEYLVPDTERIAQAKRERDMSDISTITPEFGFWYREGDTYMHFDELTQGGVLEGISHYVFDADMKMKRTLFAQRGVYHDISENRKYWLLEKVIVTDFEGDQNQVREYTSMEWSTSLAPDFLATEMVVQPDKLSISELKDKISYMDKQGLNSGRYQIGYWQKLLQPLSTIGLVFVAISFIFGPLRESSMGMRIVSGLIVGIVFKFLQDLFSPASMVFGFPPLIATLAPITVCFLTGAVLLHRASRA